MDQHAANYKFNESRFNAVVESFRNSHDVGAIRDELALAKALLNELVDNSTTPAERQRIMPVVRDTLKVIATLSQAHAARELAADRLLSKDALYRWAREASSILADELEQSGFSGWEDVADRVSARLVASVQSASNEKATR
jgi:hypothetical protein